MLPFDWKPQSSTARSPARDMGSGQKGGTSTQAAWIYNPRIGLTTPTNTSVFNGGNAPAGASSGYDPDCYSVSNMLVDASNVTFFRLGGPGGDGVGCN